MHEVRFQEQKLKKKTMEEFVKDNHGALVDDEVAAIAQGDIDDYKKRQRNNRQSTMRDAERRRKPMRTIDPVQLCSGKNVFFNSGINLLDSAKGSLVEQMEDEMDCH